MNARDGFGVAVRTIGVWQIVLGLHELVGAANIAMNLYRPSVTSSQGILAHAIAYLIIGFVLFFSGEQIVEVAYPSRRADGAATTSPEDWPRA